MKSREGQRFAQGHTAHGGRSGLKSPRLACLSAPPALRRPKSQHATLTLPGPITRMGDPVCGLGEWGSPLLGRGPLRGLCRVPGGPGCSCLIARARAAGSRDGAPPPHPQQEVAGRGRRGPRLTRGALPHWPHAAPTAGRGTRGRAGAGLDTPQPAGALHLAAARERLPCPCPALCWPLRPPPPPPTSPPLGRGGRAHAASDPSCRSSLLFFPLPVWHGHH